MVAKEECWPLCRIEEHQLCPKTPDAALKLGYLPRGSFLDSNHTGLRSQKKKICLHICVGCNESEDAADNFQNMNHRASELTTVLYVFVLFRKGYNMVLTAL